MVAIKIADLDQHHALIDLDDGGQQVTGGGYYAEWAGKAGASLQHFLDGYKAGDYNLEIVEEDGKKYLSFYSTYLFLGGKSGGKPISPGAGVFALE